jgi:hypothetical protein
MRCHWETLCNYSIFAQKGENKIGLELNHHVTKWTLVPSGNIRDSSLNYSTLESR